VEQLFVAAAKLLPEEKLIDDLSEALQNYKILKNEDTKNKLLINVLLLSTKFMTEKKDLMETLKDFDQKKKVMEMFDNRKQ
jgi:hypothetical protein